ncbi:MAG: LuxR family transcriptional regulator [Pseudomonadota bacterium]
MMTPIGLQEFAEETRAAKTVRELWILFRTYLESWSIPLVSYHHGAAGAPPAEKDGIFAVAGFPKAWTDEYIEADLARVDPIPELALRTVSPFFWSDTPKLMRLIPEQTAYLKKLFASGVGDGIAVQVFGPKLRNGYVGLGFGGAKRPMKGSELRELQASCQIAHLRYCELTEGDEREAQPLSMREREILHWVARGKSNAVIGDILGLSSHTVDAYLRRVYAKLEVSDRTSAAIRGVGAGLVLGVHAL